MTPWPFLYLLGGFLMGLVFGAIPGLTATLAIALLLPFTFGMEITHALIMVMGIYMAGIYAGSITGITVNIPGAPSGAITSIDGHALMKKGHGAQALSLDALASAIGGMIGAVVLMLLAEPISHLALLLKTPDKFGLVVMAVVTVTIVAQGSLWRAIIATTLGLMISTIGIDPMVPQGRFDFGSFYLIEGVGLLPAVIGLFAVCELLAQGSLPARAAFSHVADKLPKLRHRDFIPDFSTIREIGAFTYIKSSIIGVLIGMLPGGGASMASFISYAEAKRASNRPEEFGNGSHEGLAASESANNAMCGGAIIPLLTLGIPGDAVTAIIFGVLLLHGLVPGPRLARRARGDDRPDVRGAVRRLADGDGIGSDLRALLPPDCGYQSRNLVRLHRAGIDGRGLRVVLLVLPDVDGAGDRRLRLRTAQVRLPDRADAHGGHPWTVSRGVSCAARSSFRKVIR